jgi:hypothetical protein
MRRQTMSKGRLVTELCAGPYLAEIYQRGGWFLSRFEVDIRGEGDVLCYKLKFAIPEALYDLAAKEEHRLGRIAGQQDARAEYMRACGKLFVELCVETARLVTHLSSGRSAQSFPGYRLAPDEHHHVYFKDREQEHESKISR